MSQRLKFVSEALHILAPGQTWSLVSDDDIIDYDEIFWDENNTLSLPASDVLFATAQELEDAEAAKTYQRLRKAEYDKLNQYELMFDDKINGTTKWQEAINEIKARYPKPSE